MVIIDPSFTINGVATNFFDATSGQTITLQVANASGVDSVSWEIVGLAYNDQVAPTIAIDAGFFPLGIKASFVVETAASKGLAYRIKCTVNGAVNSTGQTDKNLVSTGTVRVRSTGGYAPIALGETFERDSTLAYVSDLNTAIATVASGGSQNLSQTLFFGNHTAGIDVVIDNGDVISITDSPVNPTDGTNKSYVDGYFASNNLLFIRKDGSVAFTGDQSLGAHKITNLANGTNPSDAINLSQLDGYDFSSLVVGGDLTGTIGNAQIASGVIVNTDINPSAAILVSKLADGSALSVLGRSANSSGAHADIAGADNQVLRISGSVLGFGAVDLSTAQVTGVLPTANQASQTMAGDVTGTTAASVVAKINATTVSTAGGSLTTGKVLRVTGSATSDWGAVDLANANAVTGTLPIGNQASQSMGGDVTGTTAANTVVKLQNRTLSSSAPSDGYVITWDATSSTWKTSGHDINLGTYGFSGASLSINPNSTGQTNSTVLSVGTANYTGLTSAYRSVSITTTGTFSHVAGSYSNPSMVRLRQFTVAGDSATAAFTGVQSNLSIQGPPVQGTNATLANPVDLWLEASGGAIAIGAGAMPTTGNIRFGYVSQASGGIKGITGIANDGSTQESLLSWNTVTNSLRLGGNTANDLTKLLFKTGGTGILFSSASDEYSFNETRADWGSNTLINVANIQFPGTGVSTMTDGYLRFPNGTVLAQSKSSGGTEVHVVRLDNTDKLFFGDSVASGITTTIMSVATGGSHSWRINNSEIAKMDGTKLDLDSQNLTFTGAGTPATDGYINGPRNPGRWLSFRNCDNTGTINGLSVSGDPTFTDMHLGDGGSKGTNSVYLDAKTQGIIAIGGNSVLVTDANKISHLESASPPTSGTATYVGEFVEGGQLKSISPRGIKTTLSY